MSGPGGRFSHLWGVPGNLTSKRCAVADVILILVLVAAVFLLKYLLVLGLGALAFPLGVVLTLYIFFKWL